MHDNPKRQLFRDVELEICKERLAKYEYFS
jgi:hypothetical protein